MEIRVYTGWSTPRSKTQFAPPADKTLAFVDWSKKIKNGWHQRNVLAVSVCLRIGVAASKSFPHLAAVLSIWCSVPLVQILKYRFDTFELFDCASVNYVHIGFFNCAIQQTTLHSVQEELTYRIFSSFFMTHPTARGRVDSLLLWSFSSQWLSALV